MDPIIGGSLIGGGFSMLSNLFGANSASRQMAFQERMSNTAHQREIADMRKAGINPILSVTGGHGASQPVGTSFTPENPMRDLAQTMVSRQGLKQSGMLNQKAMEKMDADIVTQQTQQGLNSANATEALQRALTEKVRTAMLAKEMDLVSAKTAREYAETGLTSARQQTERWEQYKRHTEAPKQLNDWRYYTSKSGQFHQGFQRSREALFGGGMPIMPMLNIGK